MQSNAQRYKAHISKQRTHSKPQGLGILWLGLILGVGVLIWGLLDSEPEPLRHVQIAQLKPAQHWRWKTKRAAEIADIWGLTPDEVSKPVVLWK